MDLEKIRRLESEPTHQLFLTILQDGPKRPSVIKDILDEGAEEYIRRLPERYRKEAAQTVKELRKWQLQNVHRYLERLLEYHHVIKITDKRTDREQIERLGFEIPDRSSTYFATPRSHQLLIFTLQLFVNTISMLNATDRKLFQAQCEGAVVALGQAEAISQICQATNSGVQIQKRDKKYEKRIKSIDQKRYPEKKNGRLTYKESLEELQRKCNEPLKGSIATEDERVEYYKLFEQLLGDLHLPKEQHWDVMHIALVTTVYLLLAFPLDNADPRRMVNQLYNKTHILRT